MWIQFIYLTFIDCYSTGLELRNSGLQRIHPYELLLKENLVLHTTYACNFHSLAIFVAVIFKARVLENGDPASYHLSNIKFNIINIILIYCKMALVHQIGHV